MQQAKIDGEKIITVEGIADGKLECFYLGRIPGLHVGVYFFVSVFHFYPRQFDGNRIQTSDISVIYGHEIQKNFQKFYFGNVTGGRSGQTKTPMQKLKVNVRC